MARLPLKPLGHVGQTSVCYNRRAMLNLSRKGEGGLGGQGDGGQENNLDKQVSATIFSVIIQILIFKI